MGERLISLVGIAAIIGIAVLFSSNRRAIRIRVVVAAFALQAVIAAIALYSSAGKKIIAVLSSGVQNVIDYSDAGITMVFGNLAALEGFSFAVRVLPLIVFFSSLMAVLYHMRIMQFFVKIFGGLLQWMIGTSPVESLNAAANVFVGQTESPLVVKPYLKNLSDVQVFTIMVSGLASIAGTVLAAYAGMGVRLDYLLAASFMAAPGGLLMAKLIMPDDLTDAQKEHAPLVEAEDSHAENVILAAANGAAVGVRLAVNIGAMLIAFVALIALFNGIVGGLGNLIVDLVPSWTWFENLSLERMLGYIFSPLMYLLSVPWEEAQITGALFGEKLILNEFVGFLHMGEIIDTMSPRAEAVATFSLCGFANLSSIAILLGGLGSLIPEKRDLIGRFGLKAVLAGSLSNLMSAALASLLIVF